MGEEQKKPEEKKPEETKKEKSEEDPKDEKAAAEDGRKDGEEKKSEEQAAPPQEIVLKVYMHCEGCARKVRRCLKGFEGVEDVITDCRTSKVIVKGENADALKVLERVQRKSHRQVELISPIPKPPPQAQDPKKADEDNKAVTKAEEKKEEPKVIAVVLGVYMHCEACAQEIKKRILKMKGVESAEPELKSSQVKVKGIFEPEKLVDYVHKRTGKHATIVKVEPEKKDEDKPKEGKEDKKPQEAQKEEEEAENKEEGGESGGAAPVPPPEAAGGAEDPKSELRKNELYYYNYPQNQVQQQVYPQRFVQEYYAYAYPPPQIFSDENPNACCVM